MACICVDLASLASATDATKKLTSATEALGRSYRVAQGFATELDHAIGAATAAQVKAAAASTDLARKTMQQSDAQASLAKRYTLGVAGMNSQAQALAANQAKLAESHGVAAAAASKQIGQLSKLGDGVFKVFSAVSAGENPMGALIGLAEPLLALNGGFQAAAASGAGFEAVIAAMYAELSPLLVTLAPVAAAAALIGGAFAITAQQINKDSGDLTKGLGLTAEQLANVKDKTVTMGDVAVGTWKTVSEAFMAAFGPQIEAVGKALGDFYQSTVDGVVLTAKTIVMAFGGAVGAVQAGWGLLPRALGDVTISTANIVIKGVETLVNGSIGLINGLIETVNGMAKALHLDIAAPKLDSVKLTPLKNQYAGAAADLGAAMAKGAASGSAKAGAAFDAIGERFEANIVKVTQARIVKEGGKGAAAAKAVDEHTQAVQHNTDAVAAANLVVPEATEAVTVYTGSLEAVTIAHDDTVKTMRQVIGEAPHFTTALESMAMEAERTAKQASDISKAIEGVAKAAKAHDFTGVFTGLVDVLGKVKTAFGEGKTAADKFAAVGGVAQGVGAIIGGKTGGVISGAGSGAVAGAQFGPAVAAIGAALGGALSLIGASAAKAQARHDALFKTQQDLQAKQMISTDSVAKSLEVAAGYQNRDLEYSSAMLNALRAINGQIGVLANSVGRAITTGGLLSTSGLGLGTTAKGPGGLTNLLSPISMLLPGLFGSKTKTELVDQGVQFNPTTFGQVANLSGQSYADLVSTTTKKFLGVTVGTKVKTSTTTSGLDGALLGQVSGVIAALGAGVITAASTFGDAAATAAEAALANATIDLGKLSLKGLSSEDIEKLLNATFSKAGDDLAKAGVPGLDALAKVGEGAFETLARVAREYQVVDVAMQSIGKTFGAVGLASLEARSRLVNLAGGLDQFNEQTAFFAENFMSEAERLAPIQNAVTIEMARLGLAGVQTKDQFKQLVLGLDVSTAEGAQLYASLMAVAPAFAKVADAAAAAGGGIGSLADRITDAIGKATSEIDKQISASSAASDAAAASASNYRQLAKSLKESVASLRGGDLSTLSPGQKLAESRTGLDALFGRALSGDTAAMADLPQAATDFLTASRDYNASSVAYGADFQRVTDMLAQAGVAANADAGIMDYQAALLQVQTGVLEQIRDNLAGPSPDTVLLTKQASLLETIGVLLQDQTTQLVTVNSSLRDQNGNIIQGNAIVSAQTGELVAVQSVSAQSLVAAQAAAVAQTTAAQLNAAGQVVVANGAAAGQIVGAQSGAAVLIAAAQTVTGANIGAAMAQQTGQVNANQALTAGQIVISQLGLGALLTSGNKTAADQLGVTQFGNLLINASTGAITTLDGHVVTGNTLIDAQTGAVTSVTGAVRDQTGAVLVGNVASDAIRNIGAQNNQYSQATLEALVGSSVKQAATYGDLLSGANTMVGLLQQIRDLTAAKATEDQAAAAKAAADAVAAATKAAQDAAALAAQKAAADAAAAASAATAQPNWSAYLVSNPDVLTEYNRLSKNNLRNNYGITTPEQFAQWHWNNYGQAEGRKPYARGGVFTNGVVTQPTQFDASIMGEGGRPEAIVPLVRGPQGLGVRTAASDPKSQAETNTLLREIKAELQADKRQRGAAAMAANSRLDALIDTMEATKRASARRTAA